MSQTFNFYEFLKDATNPSLVFLQDNAQYDDVLQALAEMFEKLYLRVQEIKVTNSMDIQRSSDFQKYLNTNDGTVQIDFILEYAAKYLDTDHFKDTVALLIRQYREREVGGVIPNLDVFVRDEIIPSFKFFTLNAGDLHKSKGVKGLVERIFEFYGPTATYEKMFDGVAEYDDADQRGLRLERYTSFRVSISEDILLNNYPLMSGIIISEFMELDTHKFVLASGYVFISRKDRDDWWIVDSGVDSIHKVDETYFVLRQGSVLSFYSDTINLYDSSFDYVTPTPETTRENVEFIPQVINISDPLNEYHAHNLYFVEKVENSDTFSDFEYNLVRYNNNVALDQVGFQMVRRGLGISYDPLSYVSNAGYPRITQYVSLDYIWIDLYEDGATTYDFDKEDAKLVYSYVMEYESKQPDGLGGFTYPKDNLLVVARDGYNYDPEGEGFYYRVISKLDSGTEDKYIFQERVVTSILREELNKSISKDVGDIKTVFDVFLLNSTTRYEDNYYTFKGYWNVSTGTGPVVVSGPDHGDYWKVDVAGTYNLNGIKNWEVDDIIVWNDNFGYWEKNNEILDLTTTEITRYTIDRTLIALNTPEFDYIDEDDNSMVTPYEKSGGMFLVGLSSIEMDIDGYGDVYSSDSNSIETFGSDPFVMFTYKSNLDTRDKIISIKMNGFSPEVDRADITRILRQYPFQTSKISINTVEFTDKHIIVYCRDPKNTSIGSMAIVMENTGYNIPLGLRTNDMKVQYYVDFRSLTRENQPFYRVEDDDGEVIDDEEVAAFQATLERYTPINTQSETLAAVIKMGYTDQKIVATDEPEQFTVEFPSIGSSKDLKEQADKKMQERLFLRVDGDPLDVNCDCARQNDLLYVYDFEAMTIFYDIINRIPDPHIIPGLIKVPVYKKDIVRDEYSKFQDVCRWESSWFEYFYDEDDTFPMRVRTKIRVNLYEQYQSFIPWGSNGNLIYNWGIHFKVQFFDDDPTTTIIDWTDAIDEEVYKEIVEYDECNPVGQFWTTDLIDDGSTVPMVLVDEGSTFERLVPASIVAPWDAFDVPAAKISLT